MSQQKKSKWSHRVSQIRKGQKIVDYCVEAFPILGSRSAVKKAIASNRLYKNGQAAALFDKLQEGDLLELKGNAWQKGRKFDIDIEVVYEDDALLIVNKPAGIAVNGNRIKTVENAMAKNKYRSKAKDALPRPLAVHRIDVPTLGLVILAKTKSALIEMGKAFQQNKVKKTYWAIVHGKSELKGKIDRPVQGKKAITHFERLRWVPSRVFKHLSLLALYPITGRTHQIRIHLKEEGHLIVGDKMYAETRKTILGKGLFLCAAQLSFTHPLNNKQIDVQLDLPLKFKKVLDREEKRFGKK